MWQVLAFFAVFGLLVVTAKIAILVLILAGLIFRTRETVALLIVGGILTAFTNHPWIVTGVIVTLLSISYYYKRKELREEAGKGTAKALPKPDN